jgi:hypothetical protein
MCIWLLLTAIYSKLYMLDACLLQTGLSAKNDQVQSATYLGVIVSQTRGICNSLCCNQLVLPLMHRGILCVAAVTKFTPGLLSGELATSLVLQNHCILASNSWLPWRVITSIEYLGCLIIISPKR